MKMKPRPSDTLVFFRAKLFSLSGKRSATNSLLSRGRLKGLLRAMPKCKQGGEKGRRKARKRRAKRAT